jgi:hypothetical protein
MSFRRSARSPSKRQLHHALVIGEGGRLIGALTADLLFKPRDPRETFISPTFKLAATSRSSGSTASYCRRARVAS